MSTTVPKPKGKLGPPPLHIAKIRVLAVQEQSHNGQDSNIEQRILDRIKKCLERAQHRNTPEAEAQAAWRLASRLMAQYNVTQSDLLKHTSDDDQYADFGGQSVVAITRARAGGSRVTSQVWVMDVAIAMETLYDCKCYSTRLDTSIEWTFYGIATNTVAAAMAFEMAHNLILEWARGKTGPGAKYSYCLGVGEGLEQLAQEEKDREAEQARRAEQQDDGDKVKSPIVNSGHVHKDSTQGEDIKSEATDGDLAGLLDPDSSSEDDEEDEVGLTFDEAEETPLDLDIDLDRQLYDMIFKQESANSPHPSKSHDMVFKQEPSDSPEPTESYDILFKQEPADTPTPTPSHDIISKQESTRSPDIPDNGSAGTLTTNPWHTSQALVHFRKSAQKVAEEYLKQQNIKLASIREVYTTVRNQIAYQAGIEDSRKIDLKRKRIEG